MSNARFALSGLLGTVLSAVGVAGCFEALPEMHAEVALPAGAASCDAAPAAGRLCGCVYDVPRGTRHLPDFASLQPVEMLCVDRLAVTLRNGEPGFPGITSRYEWFGADFQGSIMVEQAGTFGFRLASDDGAKLVIDDAVVLNNDGTHDIRVVEGVVALEAGPHRVRVPYFDGPGPMALTLEVARVGEPYQLLRFDHTL